MAPTPQASQYVSKRRVCPLYPPTGNPSTDRLAFFHVMERLKISNPESISDHMYRMALLAMCATDATLDISKCVMMCLVHDLAEAQVGDISPREGIPKAEKQRLEATAMHNFVHDMLHNSAAAQKIEMLWKEYEDGQTDEARFVKDLDRFEMAVQAQEYEFKDRDQNLQPFFDSSLPNIKHPEVQSWGRDLAAERVLCLSRLPESGPSTTWHSQDKPTEDDDNKTVAPPLAKQSTPSDVHK